MFLRKIKNSEGVGLETIEGSQPRGYLIGPTDSDTAVGRARVPALFHEERLRLSGTQGLGETATQLFHGTREDPSTPHLNKTESVPPVICRL